MKPSVERSACRSVVALSTCALALCAYVAPAFADADLDAQMKGAAVIKDDKDWKIALGAGARVAPEYEGADSFDVSPGPYVSVTWRNRIFLNTAQGLGVYARRNRHYRLGASIGYAAGRDEDEGRLLRGMGDVDPGARAQIFGALSLGGTPVGEVWAHAEVSRDFGASDGFQIEPGVSLHQRFGEDVRLSSILTASWSDGDYMDTFFSVTPAQSARSILPAYDAGAGFRRADLRISLTWEFAEHWFTRTAISGGILLGDAADSPVTETAFQPSAGLMVGYQF